MTIDEMNQIKDELGLTYQKICFESGVPIGTIQKVLGGITKNPRMETMQKLEETFDTLKRGYHAYGKTPESSRSDGSVIRESGSYGSFKIEETQGSGALKRDFSHVYTADEREGFPKKRRTEIIDGILYDMAAPAAFHQSIGMEVYKQIDQCIRTHQAQCYAFMAPTDVYPDKDKYTVVQPDVFIVCDKKKITRKNIQGAPDFVLEVLSPSTRKKDQFIKLPKYALSGVKEYWMIDPDHKRVVVCSLNEEEGVDQDFPEIEIYGFSDRIPLRISAGKCVIDMNPIRELLNDLYGM